MRLLTFILSLSITSLVFSQTKEFYKTVPKKHLKSTKLLANYLTNDAANDSVKAARIYNWITHNIAYDYDAIKSGKPLRYQNGIDVLKKKKAVCQGYATLCVELFNHVGIPASLVEGYTRSIQSDSIQYIADSDHAWVSFKINGKWHLCEPTWDAGYIGRIPKKIDAEEKKLKLDKKHAKRLDKIANKKRVNRLKKRWEKQEKKKEKKAENAPAKGEFTNKIGFVFQSKMDYFMADPDTFLYSHLPSIPEFQLRTNPITMPDYTSLSGDWDSIIHTIHTPAVDFSSVADEFAKKKLHEQWLQTAKEGLEYNPFNYGSMAVHHHNYIGLHLSEGFRKQFPAITASDLSLTLPELRVLNDSTKIYAKKAQKISRVGYGITKRVVARESKIFKGTDKLANTTVKKVISSHDKTVEKIKKQDDRSKKAIVDLEKRKQKITSISASFSNPVAFDSSWVPATFQPWKDSLFKQIALIDSLRISWSSKAYRDSIFDQRFDLLKYAYEQSYQNTFQLGSAPIYYDDSIAITDSIVGMCLVGLMDFNKETYNTLFYPDQVGKELKEFEKMVKTGTARLKKYAQQNASYTFTPLNGYLQSLQFQMYATVQQDWMQARAERRNLLEIEDYYADKFEQIETNLITEKKFKVKNTEHSTKTLNQNQKRTAEMYNNIIKGVDKNEEFFKKMLGAKQKSQ